MQNYKPIKANDFMSRSRETINNNMQSIASDFSGTSFPTANLFAYMRCYREDQNKLYRLQADLKTWRLEIDFSGKKVTIENSHSAENAEKSDSLTAEHVVSITTNQAKTGFVIVSEKSGKQTSKEEELSMFDSLKQQLLDFCFPVGYVMTTASSVNPSETHGGTWKLITEGTFIVAAGTSTKYRQGVTGGEAEHTLTADEMPKHTHSNTLDVSLGSASIPNHYHGTGYHNGNNTGRWLSTTGTTKNYPLANGTDGAYWNGSGGGGNSGQSTSNLNLITSLGVADTGTIGNHSHSIEASLAIDTAGEGAAHNNLPPYLAMYMWQRVK